jgi:DNA repair exonuclease SbcCD ATPase subunit
MKRTVLLILSFLTFFVDARAQRSAEALEPNDATLQERFTIMRDKSESYSEYKVIRTYVLDGMWKITMDSMRAQKAALREAQATIKQLQGEVASVKAAMKSKDEAVAQMEHDSSHISVLGIDFLKSVFLSTVGIIILGLLVLLGLLVARVKWVQSSMREKIENAEALSHEFEEYKRNALEKQMKLSRELQDERNKLHDLRSS